MIWKISSQNAADSLRNGAVMENTQSSWNYTIIPISGTVITTKEYKAGDDRGIRQTCVPSTT